MKAHAWLRVCNYSTEPSVSVAVASWRSNTWQSEGWWTIENGSCATVVGGGRLSSRYYYVRAEGRNGGIWGEGSKFCTLQSRFTIYAANEGCRNGTFKGFNRIDTGNYDNFTHNLRD
ncbi:MAG: DUF1036 domain-containing protein [Cyanobacteriota bacterium]